MFLANGTPVRATLGVTFKEFVDVEIEVRKTPTASSDQNKTRTVKRGDTLSSIAAAEYDDPTRWRPIARANHIENPRSLEPGQVLAIPPLT
jgi:nucleoid-associated protein YgaU